MREKKGERTWRVEGERQGDLDIGFLRCTEKA